jgi:hypothetical protein
MRMMKLAWVMMVAFLVGSTWAHAVTIKKRIEAPGLPPQIWEHARGFCAIKTWHPAVAECVEEKGGDAVFRTLTLKGWRQDQTEADRYRGSLLQLRNHRKSPPHASRKTYVSSELSSEDGFIKETETTNHQGNRNNEPIETIDDTRATNAGVTCGRQAISNDRRASPC